MRRDHFKSHIVHALAGIVSAILILFVLLNYMAAAIQIEGDSMEPVLHNREKIIILKLPITKYHLERFDIIVFSHPRKPDRKLIKRVIGLPGERLEIKQGEIWINNQSIQVSDELSSWSDTPSPQPLGPVLIPENCYFVVGDNRNSSRDSRDFGPVHINAVIGKAFFRYWPFSRMGKIS